MCFVKRHSNKVGIAKTKNKSQKWVVHSWSSLWIQSHVEQHIINCLKITKEFCIYKIYTKY
jgi:hypothetical protein